MNPFANSYRKPTRTASVTPKSKSSVTASNSLLTLSIPKPENLTSGLTEYQTPEFALSSAWPFQCSLEATLDALLTHSRYLRPRKFNREDGYLSLWIGRKLILLAIRATTRSMR